MKGTPRIVFYALRDLHVPVLLPVYHEVARRGGCDVGFAAPPYRPAGPLCPPEGLPDATRAHLRDLAIPVWELEPPSRFDCVVVADACYDRVEGWGPIVCVGHGTISKHLYFTKHPVTRRENFARVLCVPGPWYARSFGDEVFTRVVPTGFSKMDELAAPSPNHRHDLLTSLGCDPAKRTILFAPTFNPELTSLAILFKTWAAIDPNQYQVIFKLHGATDEAWKRRYRELAARHAHLTYVEASSLSPYLLACDVVVSDVSSAYVEAYAVGTPVIVVNNPAMTTYPRFNAEDIEYAVRDGAYQVRTGDELVAALADLQVQDPLARKRADYARQLFAPLDGRSSARIADEILAVAAGETPHKLPRPDDRMSVLLADGVADAARLEVMAANIRKAASPLTAFTRGPGPASIAGLPVETLRPGQLPPQPFIHMTGTFSYPDDWDLLWFMGSYFSPGVKGVFGPMLPDRDEYGPQRYTQCFRQPPALSDAELQTRYKHTAFGQLSSVTALQDDGLIFSKGLPREIAARWLDHLGHPETLAAIAKRLTARHMFIGVVPAFFAVDARPIAAAPSATVSRRSSDAADIRPSADVLFYSFKNVHLAIFAPVIAAVRRLSPGARIRFTAPPHDVGAREGLSSREREAFAAETGAEWVRDVASARAGVVVIADCVADRLRGERRIVNLGHGLISKGQYFGSHALIGRENLADAICVPGPWHADRLSRHLYIPIHTTGMSKLDGLVAPFDEAAFRRAQGLPAEGPVILWCPTFNRELSSLPVIGAGIRRLTPFGHVVIKVHGTTDPSMVKGLRDALARDAQITFADPSSDATPFMRCASVLVTDVSSVMFEFAALDRPVVLVDSPHQAEYRHYDPADIEYAMRDLGARVRDVDELVEAVRGELAEPGRRREARRRATAAMFAATDGANSERIARVLLDRPSRPPWLGPFDLVLPPDFADEDAAFSAPGMQMAANVIGPAKLASASASARYRPYTNDAELEWHLRRSQSEQVLVLRHRARLIGDWRAPLFGPLYAHRDAPRVTAPLSTSDERLASHVTRHLKRDRLTLPSRVTPETLAGVIRITNPGEWTEVSAVDSPVVAMRRASALEAGSSGLGWAGSAAPAGVLVGDALACS